VGRAKTHDIKATFSELQPVVVNDKFTLQYNGRSYIPTPHAMNQLSTRLKIGQWYARYLTGHEDSDESDGHIADKQDAETLVNCYRNGMRVIDPAKKFVWRTRDDGTLRAHLTESFAPIDNRWLVESLSKIIPGGRLSHWEQRSDGVDTILGNVLIPDSIRVESDSEYGGGVSIGNSEIGIGALYSNPWLFRAICMNGCIWDKTKGVAYKRIHKQGRGSTVNYEREYANLHENITKQIPLVDNGITKLLALKAMAYVGDVKTLFAQFMKDTGIKSVKTGQRLLEAYNVEPMASAFGIVQAVTRTSQTLANIDLAIELDEWAGSIVKQGKSLWESFTKKAQSLTIAEVDGMFV